MNRIKEVLFIIIVLTMIPAALFSQQEKERSVYVAPFQNSSGDTVLDSAGLVCRDTIVLTLRLLGGYRILDAAPGESADAYVIEGTVGYNAGGSIELKGKSTDRLTNEVVEETTVSRGFLNLFTAIDQLTINLLSKVTKRDIVFGNATVQTEPSNLTFTVYIDGNYLGRNLNDLSILIGTHMVEIKQDRPFGRETIFSDQVVFQEGKRASIRVKEPALTTAEEAWFARLDARIARDPKSNKALNDTIIELEETISLLSGLPSETFQTKRAEYQGHLVYLKDMKRKGRLRDKQNSVSFSANFNMTPYLGQFTEQHYNNLDPSLYYMPDFSMNNAGGFFELNYRRLENLGKMTSFFEAGISWGAVGAYIQTVDGGGVPLDEYDGSGVWGLNIFIGAGIKYPVISIFYLWASGDIGWSWYFRTDEGSSEEFKDAYDKSFNNMGILVLPKIGFGVQLFNMIEVEAGFFYHFHSSNNQLCRGGLMASVGYMF